MSQFFTSGSQSIRVSASASVLPMNIQDWFPLWCTGWIPLQSKRLSRVSPASQLKTNNSSALSFLYCPTLTSICDYWKNHSFDCCCCCYVASVVFDSVWPHWRQPTSSPVPGILQARTLEWVAISFSNAGKWKVRVKSFSRVRLLATPWTAAN